MSKRKSLFKFLILFIPGICMALDALADYVKDKETEEEIKELVEETVNQKFDEISKDQEA